MRTQLKEEQALQVLLVEDNPGDAGLIRHALDLSDHPVHLTVCPDGLSALGYLRRGDGPPVQIILLDLGLPLKDGWDVLSELKADIRLKDIPVLILTGSEDAEDSIRATFSRADDYLLKPKDLIRLSALLHYLEKNWFSKFRPKRDPD